MLKIYSILFLIVVLAFNPAQAESPYTGGMKYTTVNKSKPKSDGTIKQTTLNDEEKKLEKPENDTPAGRIWKKYKALASGQAEEEPKELENQNDQNSSKEQTNAEKPNAEIKQTGLAAIIEKYHENKERQSQMRVIEVQKPKKPDAPEVEKPSVEN